MTTPASQALPLEAIAALNSAFSPDLPGLQLHWDSTSYRAFLRCRWLYYLTHIQGYGSSARNVNLSFGVAFHEAMRAYYSHIAAGAEHEDALQSVVAAAFFRQLRTPAERYMADHGFHEESVPEDRSEGAKRHAKTPRSLIRTIIAYLDLYEGPGKSDDFYTLIMPDGSAAVELSFRAGIPGTPYTWGGHMDRVVSAGAPIDLRTDRALPPGIKLHPLDYKTTTSPLDYSFFASFTPDVQMTGYDIAGGVILPWPTSGVIVDGVRVTGTGTEFARHLVPRIAEHKEEFLAGFLFNMGEAERCATQREWPQNFTACHNDGYGRPCQFRAICSLPHSARQAHLGQSFVRKIWDCTIER